MANSYQLLLLRLPNSYRSTINASRRKFVLRQQTGAHKVRTRTSIGSRVSTENKNRELRTRYVDAKKS